MKHIAYLLLALAGVPTPIPAASAVQSPPPSALSDYDREVVWQDFHEYSQPARMAACDLSAREQRRWARADARRHAVPTRTIGRYVKAYRVYVWDNC